MSWEKDAACKDKPLEWFIPDGATHRGAYDLGREVCRVCPVVDECLTAAMREEGYGGRGRYGLRGNKNPKERDALRAPLVCEVCGAEFHAARVRATCSDRCAKIRDARYIREYQRTHRNTGTPNPIAKHGTVAMAHTGCTCPACRGRRRNMRRETRMNASLREVS